MIDRRSNMRNISLVVPFLTLASCAILDDRVNSGAKATGIPYYGNWCGPDRPSSETVRSCNPKPVDQIDNACMYHDKCYDEAYHFENTSEKEEALCQCDKQLRFDLDEVHDENFDFFKRSCWKAMREFFKLREEWCTGGEKFPLPAFLWANTKCIVASLLDRNPLDIVGGWFQSHEDICLKSVEELS